MNGNNNFRCVLTSSINSPNISERGKKLGAAKILYFRLATVFCMGYRLSKHKMTRYSKNLGGHCLPSQRLWSWLLLRLFGCYMYYFAVLNFTSSWTKCQDTLKQDFCSSIEYVQLLHDTRFFLYAGSMIYSYYRFFLRKMLSTWYGPVGTRKISD